MEKNLAYRSKIDLRVTRSKIRLLTLEEFPHAGSFTAGDVDENGTLTMDETKAMYLKQFHIRDKNKDDVVTADEMR